MGCDKQQPAPQPQPQPVYYEPAPPPPPSPPPTISSAKIDLTIDCAAVPPQPRQVYDYSSDSYSTEQDPAPELTEAPRVATSIALNRDDGSTIRFSDEARIRPELSSGNGSGRYFVTAHYQPQRPNELIGHPFEDADGFTSLRMNLPLILGRVGLNCDRVRSMNLQIDGRDAAALEDIPLTSGQNSIALPDDFRSAGDRAKPTTE